MVDMLHNPFIVLEAEEGGDDGFEASQFDTYDKDFVVSQEEDDDLESLYHQNSTMCAGADDDDDDDDPFNRFLERLQHRSSYTDTYVTPATPIPPSPSDTPLWRLKCHQGQQYNVLQHLVHRADHVPSQINIYSIIARSFAPSWLYFEASHALSAPSSRFLMSVPGVVVNQGRPVVELVPYNEWLHVLSYDRHDPSVPTTSMDSGFWICMQSPLQYQSDLGFVFEGAHGLQVLVIPRIQDDDKAKRTYKSQCRTSLNRPPLRLFYASEHSHLGSPVILDNDKNRVQYGRDIFEYGLLVMDYDKVAAAPALQISCAVEYHFRISRHPALDWTNIPHPFEWHFSQGDRVTVRLRGGGRKTGCVEQIDGRERLVVDLDGEEGQQSVVWRQVTKIFDVGNEVECLSGRNKGKIGLIMEIVGNLISFSPDTKMIHAAHANMLRLIPSRSSIITGSLTNVISDRFWPLTTQTSKPKPWQATYRSGDEVSIIRGDYKGSFATIEGEHMDEVLLRVGTYGPSSFPLLWVHKAWVVDGYSGPFHAERRPSPTPRSDTPTPPAEPSEGYNTPAWDPHAGTDLVHAFFCETEPPNHGATHNEHVTNSCGHWALDSAFSHCVFRVAIEPHETNEVAVVQRMNAVGVEFVREFRREQRVVCLKDIIWKHPKPRETGRMIVINGPYKGRYVRPLRCRHSVGDDDLWEVMIIEIVRLEKDALVGPKLTFRASELVLGWQSEEEKATNRELAASIKSGPQRPSRKKIRTE